jgi:hypothetical protein
VTGFNGIAEDNGHSKLEAKATGLVSMEDKSRRGHGSCWTVLPAVEEVFNVLVDPPVS